MLLFTHQQSNYNKLETKSTMQNEDIILNVRKSTKVVTSAPSAASQNKRKKYSVTGKKQQRENRSSSQSFKYNLLPSEGQDKNEKIIKNNQGNEEQGAGSKFKRSFKYQDQEGKYNKIKGNKKVKGQNYYSQHNDEAVFADTKLMKISVPEEIKPQIVASQNKIDVNPLSKFKLNALLQESLTRNEVTTLTDIQINCYNSIFNGKDTIAKASTGSGKTLAYLIPLINQYLQKKVITQRDAGTVMLIICPSRELCLQGQKEALRCLKRCPFIVPGSLIGGEQTNHQKNRLRKGINILFSTPGRLIYHLKNTQSFKFENLKTIVFEEADRTLDMGFQANIKQIIEILKKKLEENYIQRILVSAHFNEKVEDLISTLAMDNPKYVGFQKQKQEEEDYDVDYQHQQINISKNLKQQYILMTEEERIPLVIAYLKLIKDSKVMIFVSTIDEVQYLDFLLNNMYYRDSNGNFSQQKMETRRVFKIHGDLDQKYRTNTYFQFRKQKSAIMISTEIASRGLDFPDLNHIILFDVPPTLTDYGNRVGRSARFNSSGVSLLMLHYQESDYAEQIRYYCPTLELLSKEVIVNGFSEYLNRLNIRENSLYYIEGIVRSLIKTDDEKYQLARRAYTSMLRAYAKLRNKHIFAIKKLDLKLLGRCFGINSTGGRQKKFNPKAKESHFESVRKKRKVESVKSLQVSEYL